MNVVHETSSTRVLKKRELRSEQILDEAMVVLAQEGIDALTLGRLARALGYVPAALYRYFDSKDALLAALQRRAIVTVGGAMNAALESVDARARDQHEAVASLAGVLEAAKVYVSLPETHPQAWFLVAVLLGDPRLLLSTEESLRTAPILGALLGGIRARFVRAVATGALDPGDATTRTLALWASLQGALTLEKARRIAPELPAAASVAHASVVAMLRGWGAEPTLLERAGALVSP